MQDISLSSPLKSARPEQDTLSSGMHQNELSGLQHVPQSTAHVSQSALCIASSMQLSETVPLPTGLVLTAFGAECGGKGRVADVKAMSCTGCGAMDNLNSTADSKDPDAWRCCHCRTWNDRDADSEVGGGGLVRNTEYDLLLTDAPSGPLFWSICFVLDLQDVRTNYEPLLAALTEVLNGLPDHVAIHLVTFGSAAAHYFLDDMRSDETNVYCHCVSGVRSPTASDVRYLLGHDVLHQETDGDQVESKREHDDPFLIAHTKRGFLEAVEAILQSMPSERDPVHMRARKRCMGPAMEVALAKLEDYRNRVLKAQPTSQVCGKIIVYTTGAPSMGPGSLDPRQTIHAASASVTPEHQDTIDTHADYWTGLSQRATSCDAAVYVFCCGSAIFFIPSFDPLFKFCEGEAVLFSALATENEGPRFARCLDRLLRRSYGFFAELDIVHSSSISLVSLTGSVWDKADAERVDSKSRSDESDMSMPLTVGDLVAKKNHSLVQLTSVPLASCCIDEAITIQYEHSEDLPGSYLHLQLVLTYSDCANMATRHERHVRVFSVCVATTGNVQRIVKSVDIHTATQLIAVHAMALQKQAVNDPEMGKEFVYDMASSVLLRFGRKTQMNKHVNFVLPPELAQLPLILFHLSRCPLLLVNMTSPDERAVLVRMFMARGVSETMKIVFPRLLSFNSAGDFEQLPLINLSLDSHRILFLDAGSHIFVWSGADAVEETYDMFREVCIAHAFASSKTRFPQPVVLCFNEGESQARWLRARLLPAHQDPVECYPEIQKLPPEYVAELYAKFLPTDEWSYFDFVDRITKR